MSWRSDDQGRTLDGPPMRSGGRGGEGGGKASIGEVQQHQHHLQYHHHLHQQQAVAHLPLTRVGPGIDVIDLPLPSCHQLPLVTTGPPQPTPLPPPSSPPIHAARSALVKLMESLQCAASLLPHDSKESISSASWLQRQGGSQGLLDNGVVGEEAEGGIRQAMISEMKLLDYILRTALADTQGGREGRRVLVTGEGPMEIVSSEGGGGPQQRQQQHLCSNRMNSQHHHSLMNSSSSSNLHRHEEGGVVKETDQALAGLLSKILQSLGSGVGEPSFSSSSSSVAVSPTESSSVVIHHASPPTSSSSASGGGGVTDMIIVSQPPTAIVATAANYHHHGTNIAKILLVVRSAEEALRLAIKAREQGLCCHTARSALRALADVSDGTAWVQDYQAVVVEADFPVMGGLEFVSRLRRDGGSQWRSCVVLMVRNGAACSGSFAYAARRAGATDSVDTWEQINFASLRQAILQQRAAIPSGPQQQKAAPLTTSTMTSSSLIIPATPPTGCSSGPMGSATWVHGNSRLGTLAYCSTGRRHTSPDRLEQETSASNSSYTNSAGLSCGATTSHNISPKSVDEDNNSSGSEGGRRTASSTSANKRIKRACSYCHTKKVLCRGERPCTRCVHQGVECKEYMPKPRLGKRQHSQHSLKKQAVVGAAAAAAAAISGVGGGGPVGLSTTTSNTTLNNGYGGDGKSSSFINASSSTPMWGMDGLGNNASPILFHDLKSSTTGRSNDGSKSAVRQQQQQTRSPVLSTGPSSGGQQHQQQQSVETYQATARLPQQHHHHQVSSSPHRYHNTMPPQLVGSQPQAGSSGSSTSTIKTESNGGIKRSSNKGQAISGVGHGRATLMAPSTLQGSGSNGRLIASSVAIQPIGSITPTTIHNGPAGSNGHGNIRPLVVQEMEEGLGKLGLGLTAKEDPSTAYLRAYLMSNPDLYAAYMRTHKADSSIPSATPFLHPSSQQQQQQHYSQQQQQAAKVKPCLACPRSLVIEEQQQQGRGGGGIGGTLLLAGPSNGLLEREDGVGGAVALSSSSPPPPPPAQHHHLVPHHHQLSGSTTLVNGM